METPLDYSQYSLDALYDVQRHIDKEKYPDTYVALLDEIGKRENQLPQITKSKPTKVKSPTVVLPLIVVLPLACLGLYWGGSALMLILFSVIPPAPGTRNDFEPWFGVLLGCFGLFVALLCFIPAVAYFVRSKD